MSLFMIFRPYMEACLTHISSPFNPQRMGRPPLNVRETKVYLDVRVYDRIVMIAGPRQVSAWMREAAKHYLPICEAALAGRPATGDGIDRAAETPEPDWLWLVGEDQAGD